MNAGISLILWSGEFGGMQFGGIQARKKTQNFKRLPFNYCSLSLQPFEHPVCSPDGTIFDLRNIYPYLKKHGVNPVTGEKLEPKSLIKLNFHKNANDEYHCPATLRVFNDHTHIVAIKTTGNVYAYEAIERLNIKVKNWTDLLTDEPFTRKDIITIQDPHNLENRNLSNFYYVKNNIKIDEGQNGKDNPLNDINISAVGSAARVLNKISSRQDEVSDQKHDTIIESKPASSETKTKVTPPTAGSKPKKLPYNAAPYTRGLAAASFTSTAMTPVTVNENALIDEEEFMFKEIKTKGYARITTNLGNLNVELFCDKDNISSQDQKFYGGDPTGTGKGGESYWKKDFVDEFKSNLSHNERGLLSMANKGKNTNSSQLPCMHLDNKHTIFGKLVGGKDILDKMESVPTDDSDRPLNEIKIINITVFMDPYDEYKKNLEKKLNRQSAETQDKKPRKNEKDSTTNWFGNKLTSSYSINKEDNCTVGKYLKSSISKKRELDNEDDLNEEQFVDTTPKKPKPTGYNFDFSKW
ncbi:17878_t:CDS:10 [Cetraspora pellucida]|uniref:RING-type E3 ubiquitin transferase n=2 Tax=Cetraspora pellucida TaxID=1433469 RepID=A0A9N8WFB9_9GLOM|nr:17878_t:CDS:10 [Cetraspora pellucida]